MGMPGRHRQEAIELKSPTSLKLGTIVGFGNQNNAKIFYSLQVTGNPLKCMHIGLAILGLVFLQQERPCENEIHCITFYYYQFQSADIRKSRVQIHF